MRSTIRFLFSLLAVMWVFAASLLAQAPPGGTEPSPLPTAMQLISALIMAALPFASSYIFEGLQHALTWVDSLSGIVKQLIAIVLPIGVNFLGQALGIDTIPGDVHAWTQTTVLGIVQGLASIGIFHTKRTLALGVKS